MHILICSYNYYPEIFGIPKTNTMLAKALYEKGHKVSVITAFPNYPFRKPFKGYEGKYFLKENIDGIDVYRSYISISNESTLLKRIWHEASFIFSSMVNFFRVRKVDLVISVCPPLTGTIVWGAMCKIKRVPIIMAVKDILPDSAVNLGLMKNKPLIKVLKILEKIAYKIADKIVVISELFRENLLSKGVDSKKIECFCDFVDTNEIYPSAPDEEFLNKMGWKGKFIALYSGNMGLSQGLEVIPMAAKMLKDNKDILFVMAGEGSQKRRIEELVEHENLENLQMIDPVPECDVRKMLNCADVLVLSQLAKIKDINFPYKLGVYMASGKPIVALVDPDNEVGRVAKNSGAYLLALPENAKSLAELVTKFYNNPELCKTLGGKARRYIEKNRSKEGFVQRYEKLFKDLVSR